jgi:sodium-dependent phosphate transporter
MIGMTLVLGGIDCVIWYKPLTTFPYIGGVSGIIISWFISPLFSAIIAMSLFSILRILVLRHDFNTNRINWTYPFLIGSTIFINCFFIIYKGAKGLGLDKTPLSIAFSVSASIGVFLAMVSVPFVPIIKKKIENIFATTDLELTTIEYDINNNTNTLNIKNKAEMDDIIRIHTNAEKFDKKTEYSFRYLQIFTAICDSFSHGANDVANAIGPFATMWAIYNSTDLNKKNDMESDAYWILGLGGIGIALGLLLYGYKITHAIGNKLIKVTPSRGVVIELASALVIITGSRLKIPLSTTHCQIGATIGVGALENPKTCGGINCKMFLKTTIGWIMTCIVVGGTSGLLTVQGVYAPTKFNYCPVNGTV